MLSNKKRIILIAAWLPCTIAVLYWDEWMQFWYGRVWGDAFVFIALGSGLGLAWLLPHPRQERKRREKLEQLRQQAETEKLQSAETLAEKRP